MSHPWVKNIFHGWICCGYLQKISTHPWPLGEKNIHPSPMNSWVFFIWVMGEFHRGYISSLILEPWVCIMMMAAAHHEAEKEQIKWYSYVSIVKIIWRNCCHSPRIHILWSFIKCETKRGRGFELYFSPICQIFTHHPQGFHGWISHGWWVNIFFTHHPSPTILGWVMGIHP